MNEFFFPFCKIIMILIVFFGACVNVFLPKILICAAKTKLTFEKKNFIDRLNSIYI